MNLSRPFIERPIATVLLTIGIALAGTGGTAADGGALGPWGEAIKALVQQFGLGGVIGGVIPMVRPSTATCRSSMHASPTLTA